MNSCKDHPFCQLLHKNSGRVRIRDVYRVYLGRRQGQDIWIVDGDKVFRELYPAFVMGGNDQRYRFNPPKEVWIDNRIGSEELEYTIAHELIERKLMREKGWSYDRAHNAGLALEKKMRIADEKKAAAREKTVQVHLTGIYRRFHKTIKGLSVWFVDGPKVRKELDGDFCFAGHDLKHEFIPRNEIWLDSAMAVEQVHYALVHELKERAVMAASDYDNAYEIALQVQLDERHRQAKLSEEHERSLEPVSYGVRERGVKVKPKAKSKAKAKGESSKVAPSRRRKS